MEKIQIMLNIVDQEEQQDTLAGVKSFSLSDCQRNCVLHCTLIFIGALSFVGNKVL